MNWGSILGLSLRFGFGATAFGIWQHSFYAGAAFFFLLITIESDHAFGRDN